MLGRATIEKVEPWYRAPIMIRSAPWASAAATLAGKPEPTSIAPPIRPAVRVAGDMNGSSMSRLCCWKNPAALAI
jgi:hypothetical protein